MTTQTRKHTKTVAIILLLLALIIAMVIYLGIVKNLHQVKEVKIAGMYLSTPKDMIDFQLTDNTGKTFTKADLKGHWTLMFFGFTNCGMVCPTTLAALNTMYKSLQQQMTDQQLPRILMISVDPERDTVEKMNEYVTAFNPHFMGARAELAQIEALERDLHLVAVKMQAGDQKNQYTINHSAEIMVINPEGQLQAFLSYPHNAEEMAMDYKAILQTA